MAREPGYERWTGVSPSKRRALELLREGRSVHAVAGLVAQSSATVRRWAREIEVDVARPTPGQRTESAAHHAKVTAGRKRWAMTSTAPRARKGREP